MSALKSSQKTRKIILPSIYAVANGMYQSSEYVSICIDLYQWYQCVSGFDRPHVSENLSESEIKSFRIRKSDSPDACGRKAYPQKKRIRIQKYLDTCSLKKYDAPIVPHLCQNHDYYFFSLRHISR